MAPRLGEKEQQEFRKFMERLESYRKAMKLSQAELAKLCRVGQAAYSKWANVLKKDVSKERQNYPEPLAWVGLRALEPDIIGELSFLKKELQKRLQKLS